MPLCSLASAPLTFFGDTGGLLVALGTQSHTFLPRDVEVLQSFASQVAIALNNARRYHATKTQADCDPLTGLLNHRSSTTRSIVRSTSGPASQAPPSC